MAIGKKWRAVDGRDHEPMPNVEIAIAVIQGGMERIHVTKKEERVVSLRERCAQFISCMGDRVVGHQAEG